MKQEEFLSLYSKYITKLPKKKLSDLGVKKRECYLKQTASNCWIYSMLNNVYLNCGEVLDESSIKRIKENIQEMGIDTNKGGYPEVAGVAICDFIGKHRIVQFNVLTDVPKFAELLKKGYSFVISRISDAEFKEDVKDDGIVNEIHINDLSAKRHAVNICLGTDKRIHEIGTYSKTNPLNYFEYDTISFVRNMQTKAIDPIVLFFIPYDE